MLKPLRKNDHPEPNPLQGHTYIPQGFQKKVNGEFAKKSGRPSIHTYDIEKIVCAIEQNYAVVFNILLVKET